MRSKEWPALILEKETYPANDPGRFDLRLDVRRSILIFAGE